MAGMTRKLTILAANEGKTVSAIVVAAIKEAGSQTAAARLLGVNPNTIRYHVRKLGITVTTQFQADVVEQHSVIVEN